MSDWISKTTFASLELSDNICLVVPTLWLIDKDTVVLPEYETLKELLMKATCRLQPNSEWKKQKIESLLGIFGKNLKCEI